MQSACSLPSEYLQMYIFIYDTDVASLMLAGHNFI